MHLSKMFGVSFYGSIIFSERDFEQRRFCRLREEGVRIEIEGESLLRIAEILCGHLWIKQGSDFRVPQEDQRPDPENGSQGNGDADQGSPDNTPGEVTRLQNRDAGQQADDGISPETNLHERNRGLHDRAKPGGDLFRRLLLCGPFNDLLHPLIDRGDHRGHSQQQSQMQDAPEDQQLTGPLEPRLFLFVQKNLKSLICRQIHNGGIMVDRVVLSMFVLPQKQKYFNRGSPFPPVRSVSETAVSCSGYRVRTTPSR